MVTYIPGTDKIINLPLERAIPLDKSPIPNAIAAMRPLNQANLEALLEIEDASQLPPIEVALIQEGYVILDGYHRYERAKLRKEDTIAAYARTYKSDYEVLNFAFSANLKHGLSANSTTRTAYALWLHITPDSTGNTISMREAARRAGITHVAVSKAYKKLQDSQEIEATSEDDDVTEKRKAMKTPAEQLGKSLYAYFKSEYKTFSNNMYSSKSEQIRTKGLTRYFRKAKSVDQTVVMLRSLARSINATADSLEGKGEG